MSKEREITSGEWKSVTNQLDKAIQFIHKMIRLSPCNIYGRGRCQQHSQDNCVFAEAEIWLEDIQ